MEPRRGLGFKGFLVAAVLIIGLAAASGIIPFRQVIAYENSVELARDQRDALTAEIGRLEQQIAAPGLRARSSASPVSSSVS